MFSGSSSNTGAVFIERHVKDVEAPILYTPVPSYALLEGHYIVGNARDAVPTLLRSCAESTHYRVYFG